MANKDHSEDHDNISTTSYTDLGGGGKALDPHNLGDEPVGELAEVPDELREDTGDETKTGLVSEFRDLTGGQASYLVANRETSQALRSPLFAATALALIIGVLAALIIGFSRTGVSAGSGDSVAMMVPEEQKDQVAQQLPQVEQQLGMSVTIVTSVEEGQDAVKSGKVDAFLLQDPTGQGNDQLIAKNRMPQAIIDKLVNTPDVTYVDGGPIDPATGEVVAWTMAALTLAAGLSLGALAYRGVREERRTHTSEIIVATIPPRSALWGRIWGLTQLALLLLVITAVVGLLGMSVIGLAGEVYAALPALGWFVLSYAFYSAAVIAFFALIAMGEKQRGRRIGAAVAGVVIVVMAFLPMLPFMADSLPQVAAWLPFAEPTGVGALYLLTAAPWWHGLVAAASSAVVAVVLVMLAISRYTKTVLSGAGIAGRPAVAKAKLKNEPKGKADKVDTADEAEEADDAAEAEDAEEADKVKTKAKKADGKSSKADSAKTGSAKAKKPKKKAGESVNEDD